ncbi:hypothetical protein JCM8202v2_003522 [Rhodotorula sphaerocarpa]
MSSRTLVLELERFDAAFTHPLFAQLDQLGDKACLVAIGSLPGPSMLMHDAAVALPRLGSSSSSAAPAGATSISSSASASLSLSARLAKRYASQVFLSLDLSSLADAAGGPASSDRALIPLEKALVQQLDQVLERRRQPPPVR